MNWLKSMRHWLISTFSKKQSTNKVKNLINPEGIVHEFKEDILKDEGIRFNQARGVAVLFHIKRETWQRFHKIPREKGYTIFDLLRNTIRNRIIDAEIHGEIE